MELNQRVDLGFELAKSIDVLASSNQLHFQHSVVLPAFGQDREILKGFGARFGFGPDEPLEQMVSGVQSRLGSRQVGVFVEHLTSPCQLTDEERHYAETLLPGVRLHVIR